MKAIRPMIVTPPVATPNINQSENIHNMPSLFICVIIVKFITFINMQNDYSKIVALEIKEEPLIVYAFDTHLLKLFIFKKCSICR